MSPANFSWRMLVPFGFAAGVAGLLAGIGFALWSTQGPAMLLAMTEAAVAWCF